MKNKLSKFCSLSIFQQKIILIITYLTLSIKSIRKRWLHIRVLDRLIDDRNNKMITIYSKKNYFSRDGKSLATTLRSKYDISDWLLNRWNRNWYEKNLALIEWWFFSFFSSSSFLLGNVPFCLLDFKDTSFCYMVFLLFLKDAKRFVRS